MRFDPCSITGFDQQPESNDHIEGEPLYDAWVKEDYAGAVLYWTDEFGVGMCKHISTEDEIPTNANEQIRWECLEAIRKSDEQPF